MQWSTTPFLNADDVVGRLHQAFPDWQLQTLFWPEDQASPWFAEVRKGQVGAIGETALAVYVDPHSGEILKTHDYGRSAWRWLQLLHFNLLSGRTGRTVNGVLSLATLFCVLTGLIIWWPAERRAKPMLTITRAATGKRMLWELHHRRYHCRG